MNDPKVPDRDELRQLLLRWQADDLTFYEVVDAAEEIEERLWSDMEVGPDFGTSDPRSIAVEVVSLLSMGYTQPLFKEDIPQMLDLLAVPAGEERRGLEAFWEHVNSFDHSSREQRAAVVYE